MLVKPKPTNNPCEIGVLVDTSSPLISSQDPSKAKNTKKSINLEEKDRKGSEESSEDELLIVL
jgi:hypothetical protein